VYMLLSGHAACWKYVRKNVITNQYGLP